MNRFCKILIITWRWLINIYIWFFSLIFIYLLFRIFIYSTFTIPSGSMQPTIQPGDRIIVEKMSTGARLFDFRKTNRGERTKILRTPHWRKFNRGDVLVFNFKYRNKWDTISMNWPLYYLKRCVAIPGDTIEIRDFNYIVNGDTLERNITPEMLMDYFPPDSVAKAKKMRGYMVNLGDTTVQWTIRNLGPLWVPAKGSVLPIDTATIFRYKQLIEWETEQPIEVNNGKVYLGKLLIDEYEFKENYYFMAGDNSISSRDSRYWGLIPEEFIVGRARFIWWSEKNGKIRWNRILKSIE